MSTHLKDHRAVVVNIDEVEDRLQQLLNFDHAFSIRGKKGFSSEGAWGFSWCFVMFCYSGDCYTLGLVSITDV